MKMALVGAGGMGGVHLGVYEAMADVTIAAIVDVDMEKIRSKYGDKGIRLYEDIDEMLENEDVDFVDICTPSYLHEEHAIKVMKKGIHVLCEKPIALTKESGDRMARAAKENGVIFMVAQVIRFWPHYMYLKECYNDKRFGKLYHASFSRIGEMPKWSDWFTDVNKSGRVPIDLHIHDVDFILYMLGTPRAVAGQSIEDGEKISYISSCLTYDDCYVYAEGGWFGNPIPFSMTFRAVFENAILEYKDNKLMVYKNGSEPEEIAFDDTQNTETGINISSTNGYENEIKYFIECIKEGKQPEITTPEGSTESVGIVEKLLESARLGQKINM